MIVLKCYFFKKKENLTVGDVQKILCPLSLKESNILVNRKNFFVETNYPIPLLNYNLALIKAPVVKTNLLSLEVTSYVPGIFKDVKPVLSLGKNRFLLSNLNWKVKTILQKKSKPQGHYGPIIEQSSLSVLYISLSIFCLFIFYILYFSINRYKYKKVENQEIEKYKKAISPYNEYHQKIRAMSLISDNSFNLVKEALYIFLTRTSGVPFLQYPLRIIKKEIKKNKLFSSKLNKELFFILEDLKNIPHKLDLEKKQSLLHKINLIVDKIEESL